MGKDRERDLWRRTEVDRRFQCEDQADVAELESTLR